MKPASRVENPLFRPGVFLWLGYLAILALVVAQAPEHAVTPTYAAASQAWWQHRNLYDLQSVHGFLYLPQSAILYAPFGLLPPIPREILWRTTNLAILASALARLARFLPRPSRSFVLLSLLTIPASLASARNGQTNLPLAGAMIHGFLEASNARWNRATLWLLLSLAYKPVAIVPYLLAGALYRRLLGSLLAGTTLFLALPWLFGPSGFVRDQYQLFFQKFLISGQPHEPGFSDLSGLLGVLRIPLAPFWLFFCRALAALLTLLLGRIALRRYPFHAALWLDGLSSAYLMLFNPRTEANSYVLLAPAAAVFALWELSLGRRGIALALMTIALGFGSSSYGPIHGWTNLWFQPLLALGFLGYLALRCFRPLPASGKGS
ncbi:MAG: glycosyltransferase family 87 protein [Candidatus Methylacidiphilaceae bacterium]